MLSRYFVIGFLVQLAVFTTLFGKDVEAQLNNPVHASLQDVSLKQVFDILKKSAHVTFVYDAGDINGSQKVNIPGKGLNAGQVLDRLAAGLDLSYKMIGNTITIKRKVNETSNPYKLPNLPVKRGNAEIINFVAPLTRLFQSQISGTVKDSLGNALIGVTVQVKGTTTGTTTDANGHFTIKAPDKATLVFSYVGYQDKEVMVNGQNTINVVLSSSATGLNEVVVVGYGTQKKKNLTGAISSIEMDDVLGDRPVNDVAKALQGTIPGLQITYGSGQPGTSTNINIRGFESINGGKPLVLVDNVPMDIEDINPQDIKTVTVLKDASASAIYGARAAFGVILITTKKGNFNRPLRFNYSATLGFNFPSNIPRKASMLEFMQALEDWGQKTHYGGHDVETWKSYLVDYKKNPSDYPGGYMDDADDGHRYWLKPTNVVKDLFSDRGFDQYHNFSFSGGSRKTSYRASFGYTDENGIVVGHKDRYRKYNAGLSLTSKLTSKLTTSLDMRYNNAFKSDPFMGTYYGLFYRALGYQPVAPLGFYEDTASGERIPYRSPANEVRYTPAAKTYGENVRLSGRAVYHLVNNMTLNAEYTFERRNSKAETEIFEPLFIDYLQMTEVVQDPSSTSYALKQAQQNYSALNLYGDYTTSFGRHHFKLLLGMNRESEVRTAFSASRDLISPDVPGLSTSTGLKDVDDSYTDWGVIGFFGRLNYNFKDKYLLEINSRYDGSSRFPPGHRFGLFPSVSAGWKMTAEPFMHNLKKVSFLKLRVSWGSIGNQNISNYAYFSTMSPVTASWINSSTGEEASSFSVPGLVSDNFTWETVQTQNLGIDFGLWENRLYATLDWYNRKTLNMLAPGSKLPAVLGTNAPLQNVADLSTKGWELDIQWKDEIGKFRYSLGFNLYDNRTKILDFNNPARLISQYYAGQEIGEIWGYITDRYYTEDDFVKGSLNDKLMGGTLKEGIPAFKGKNPNPGDVLYADLNGDGEISPGVNTLDDPGDRKIIGNNSGRYQFGIRGSVAYKNADLTFLMEGIGKRDLWFNNILSFPYTNRFFTLYKNLLDYWTPENTDAYYPRNYTDAGVNYGTNRQVQTKYLRRGAYLRIKNITVGYSVPKLFLRRFGLDKFRIFLSGENLFMFDHLPQELNPLLSNLGEGGYYPFLRKLTAGFNISF